MTIKQAVFEVSMYAVAFFGATALMQWIMVGVGAQKVAYSA